MEITKNMSIELLEKSNKTFKIEISNADIYRAISIRNLLYTSIKTYAPYLVVFYANDNNLVLKSTEIAHRIGLFIVQNSLLQKEYKQGPYYKCKLDYVATEDFEDVRSNSIELLDQSDNRTGIFPFFEDFLVTQLMKNQCIHLDIYINKQNAKDHLKYRPGNITKFNEVNKDTFILEIESFGILEIEIFFKKIVKYNKKLV